MSARERRWVLIVACVLALITTLPYLAGFQAAGENWTFSGLLIGVEDGNSYLAKMLRGSAGDWLFRTPYTVQQQPGVLTFLPYLLLGKLAGGQEVHLQLVGLFHLFRVASIFLYTYALYRFASNFIDRIQSRRLATILAAVGGGLGWLVLPWIGHASWPIAPLSFISPETFGFLAILAVPHLAVARAFFLLALLSVLDDIRLATLSIRSPLLTILTFLFNPLAGVSLVLVLGFFHLAHLGLVSRTKQWSEWFLGVRASAWAGSLAAPYVAYLAFTYRQQSFLQGWAQQNLILSPHFGYYLLAFGALAPTALLWLRRAEVAGRIDRLLLAAWLVAIPFMPYLPVGVQRRLPEAGWVALSVAAVIGVSKVEARTWRRLWRNTLLLLSLISPGLLLATSWQAAINPAQPAFIEADLEAAYRQLADLAEKDHVVIANFRNSNIIPTYAPVRVPIGHGPESIGGPELEQRVRVLLAGNAEDPTGLLQDLGANWVLAGENETGESGSETYLSLIDQWGQVRLFQVQLEK